MLSKGLIYATNMGKIKKHVAKYRYNEKKWCKNA